MGPDIVKTFLRTVLKELKTVQTLATITKNVVAGVRAAVEVWTTRNLIDDIRQGTPTLIIEGVRKQIKSHGLWSVLDAVGDALTVGLNVLLPGVGELVGTIKSILGYIAELFYHYKDTTKIRAIIADSKKNTRTPRKENEETMSRMQNNSTTGTKGWSKICQLCHPMP